jgi:hypothetical protein
VETMHDDELLTERLSACTWMDACPNTINFGRFGQNYIIFRNAEIFKKINFLGAIFL